MSEFRPMSVLHADLAGPLPKDKNFRGQRGFNRGAVRCGHGLMAASEKR